LPYFGLFFCFLYLAIGRLCFLVLGSGVFPVNGESSLIRAFFFYVAKQILTFELTNCFVVPKYFAS
jgi:hypothetical protein